MEPEQQEKKDPQAGIRPKETGRTDPKPEEKPAAQAGQTNIPAVNPVQPHAKEFAQEGAGNIVEVNDLSWEKTVEKGKTPVAVMFYSPTCAFCHQMEPYFRTFAKEFAGTVLFARLNIMSSQWTAERYGVKSTPTFKFFCDGRPVQEMVGAVYPALLKRAVEEVLVHGKECARNSTAIDYEITGYG